MWIDAVTPPGVLGQRECTDLNRTSGSGLAGMERRDRGERGEAGGPRLGPWALVEPCHDPIHIDRRGGRYVLQVRFLETPIPRAAEPKRAYPLGECAFDPGAAPVLPLAFFTRIPGLGGL